MGDSVFSHEFLALVYALEYDGAVGASVTPNPIENSNLSTMDVWLMIPHLQLEYDFAKEGTTKSVGNMHYQKPQCNLSISFYFTRGTSAPVRGFELKPEQKGTTPTPRLKTRENSLLWELPWDQAIKNVVGMLTPKPTDIILNSGHWSQLTHNQTVAVRGAALTVAPRVVWSTTTACKAGAEHFIKELRSRFRIYSSCSETAKPLHWSTVDVPQRRIFGPDVFDAQCSNNMAPAGTMVS